MTETDEEIKKKDETYARLALRAADWSDEELASRVVGLLIEDRGNLNKYERTIHMIIRVCRERDTILRERAKLPPGESDFIVASREYVVRRGHDPDDDEGKLPSDTLRYAFLAGVEWNEGSSTMFTALAAANTYELEHRSKDDDARLSPPKDLRHAFQAGVIWHRDHGDGE